MQLLPERTDTATRAKKVANFIMQDMSYAANQAFKGKSRRLLNAIKAITPEMCNALMQVIDMKLITKKECRELMVDFLVGKKGKGEIEEWVG
jgi:D-alanyl-D-alanine dipeptidase